MGTQEQDPLLILTALMVLFVHLADIPHTSASKLCVNRVYLQRELHNNLFT